MTDDVKYKMSFVQTGPLGKFIQRSIDFKDKSIASLEDSIDVYNNGRELVSEIAEAIQERSAAPCVELSDLTLWRHGLGIYSIVYPKRILS